MSLAPNLRGQVVLVTGGTRGIGLATALAFGRCGAQCVVTYRWGTVPPEEVMQTFADEGLIPPLVIEANAASGSDTEALVARLADKVGPVSVFISNAANAVVVREMKDYDRRAFLRTIEASTWPTFDLFKAHQAKFGHYPRNTVVMSSDGPDRFALGYDFVGASKAALEALCRYASHRLAPLGARLNVLRSRGVRTESLEEVFGTEMLDFAEKMTGGEDGMAAQDVAGVAVALCSGWLDGMNGQVVTADNGGAFRDNIMGWYDQRAQQR